MLRMIIRRHGGGSQVESVIRGSGGGIRYSGLRGRIIPFRGDMRAVGGV